MGEIFDYVDEMGPTKIIHIHEPSHGLKAVLVVDNVAAGPAIGGLRMAPDVSTRECARLARAMTLKNALAEIPHGGAKSVIFGDPRMPREDKEKLVRELACALGNIDEYIFGPDMGTNEECMAWVNDEIGRSVGLPREVGGIPLDEIGATGWGVSQAVDVALPYCDFDLAGARVVVQGFGAVGRNAARFLAARGALLVGAADSRGTIYHADGLDIDDLTELKRKGSSVIDYNHGHKMKRDEVIDIECEIWIPAARPDVIHEDNVHRLNTRLVVEGANIPITYGAEKILHERGVLSIPDVIANAGGVICAAMEYQHASQALAMQVVEEKVRANTARILETAKADNILPRDAAVALATERVRRAMALRRWSTF
ncbi:MAG: Glu/Leu/Phe/Val dehydrogenase [Candidatus Sedimenticola sp. (ex Thyasira tokunagai)]